MTFEQTQRTEQQMTTARVIVLGTLVALVAGISTSECEGQVTKSFTEPFDFRKLAVAQPEVLTQVLVSEGDAVKSGQLLAELSAEPLKQAKLLAETRGQSRARLKAAEVKVKVARKKLDALREMQADGFANNSEIDKAELAHEEALSVLQAENELIIENRIEVDRISAELERKQVYSPIDGVVTEIHRRPGEVVGGSESHWATVVQIDRLKARFYLRDEVIRSLKKDQVVPLLLSNEERISGRVHFISPITSPDSGAARVDVVIENSGLKIRSGVPCRWILEDHDFAEAQKRSRDVQ